MAFILFTDGTKRHVAPEVAGAVWEVIHDYREPTETQAKYCERVASVWLSWRSAPDAYIRDKFDMIVQLHFEDWMIHRCPDESCMQRGMLTLPDYSRPLAWEFARKWGLVNNGKVTELGERHLQKRQPGRAATKVFSK